MAKQVRAKASTQIAESLVYMGAKAPPYPATEPPNDPRFYFSQQANPLFSWGAEKRPTGRLNQSAHFRSKKIKISYLQIA
jgi:hypothetical protein